MHCQTRSCNSSSRRSGGKCFVFLENDFPFWKIACLPTCCVFDFALFCSAQVQISQTLSNDLKWSAFQLVVYSFLLFVYSQGIKVRRSDEREREWGGLSSLNMNVMDIIVIWCRCLIMEFVFTIKSELNCFLFHYCSERLNPCFSKCRIITVFFSPFSWLVLIRF